MRGCMGVHGGVKCGCEGYVYKDVWVYMGVKCMWM